MKICTCEDQRGTTSPTNREKQNICGVSVVGSDYDKLKRYNLAEIFEPTPKPVVENRDSK